MKLTLLQVVQRTLSAMNADNVNSISDTYESEAIARVAEEVYYELISRTDWPHLEGLITLYNPSNMEARTSLTIPEDVKYVKSLWYKNKELQYKEPEEFLRFINNRGTTHSFVQVELPGGTLIDVPSDKDPEIFTLLHNKHLVMDSFDSTDGYTVLHSLASATGNRVPFFSFDDDFVPELEETVFPTYLSMVRRAAFLFFRREASPHDERATIVGLGRILQDKSRLFRKNSKINYGRNK